MVRELPILIKITFKRDSNFFFGDQKKFTSPILAFVESEVPINLGYLPYQSFFYLLFSFLSPSFPFPTLHTPSLLFISNFFSLEIPLLFHHFPFLPSHRTSCNLLSYPLLYSIHFFASSPSNVSFCFPFDPWKLPDLE